MMVELREHPIQIISGMIGAMPPDSELEFSRYRYQPQSMEDPRTPFRVSSSSVTFDWFVDMLSSLATGENIALHSRVYSRSGEVSHIPMIDFVEARSTLDGGLLANVLSDFGLQRLWIYETGRSCHAYGTTAIPDSRWAAFMGSLLLANAPNHPRQVDDRWVGHRLRAGFASLRWSCNSSQYRQYPQFVGTIDLL